MIGETLVFVCSYGYVVGPLKTGLYKLTGPHTSAGPTIHPEKHTKIKVSPLTDPQMEKKLCFS